VWVWVWAKNLGRKALVSTVRLSLLAIHVLLRTMTASVLSSCPAAENPIVEEIIEHSSDVEQTLVSSVVQEP